MLVEFGSGASVKTRLLLDALPLLSAYVPIDISQSALSAAAQAIRGEYPRLNVTPVLGDFTRNLKLPTVIDGRSIAGFFPGSTIGNFSPSAAVDFLRRARRLFGRGSKLVVGADLAKTPRVLVPAYDDAEGVTAAFNKNLLKRLNRELGANFDLGSFGHAAIWNAGESRIEMPSRQPRPPESDVAGPLARLRCRRNHPHGEFLQVLSGGLRGRGCPGRPVRR